MIAYRPLIGCIGLWMSLILPQTSVASALDLFNSKEDQALIIRSFAPTERPFLFWTSFSLGYAVLDFKRGTASRTWPYET
jgi:hypothetical protein